MISNGSKPNFDEFYKETYIYDLFSDTPEEINRFPKD